jgi:iron complex outermembrane receptor protein
MLLESRFAEFLPWLRCAQRRGKRPRSSNSPALLPIVAAIVSAPTWAQESAAAPGDTLDEIVVTAQFRQQSIQDTPLSITAINAQMLEARNQINIVDVANEAPNVVLKPAPAPYGPTLQAFIRGVGQADFNYALEPGVGMYVDDVYYSTLTGSILDLLDLDRVEVLRGPQGTLAGQNSVGGAIKLYSKKPQGDDSATVQATYGRFSRTDVRASADMTLVKDTLFGRIAGVSHHVDGYVTRYDYGCAHPGSGVPTTTSSVDCRLGTEGGKAYDAVRASLRWLPAERLEVNVAADYTNDKSEASPLTLIYVGHPAIVRSGTVVAPAGAGITASRSSPPLTSYNGLTIGNTAAGLPLGTPTGSAFISYTPFGFYAAQDTFSHSPYSNYSTYSNPAPLSGMAPGSPDGASSNNPYTVPAVSRVSSYGVSSNIDYEFRPGLSLKSITAYRAYSGDWAVDEDATPVATGTFHNYVYHRQFSQEVRLNARLFDRLNMTLGGLYFDQKSRYSGRVDLEPSRLDFLENDVIPGKTKAGFANFDWQLAQPLELITGVRYTRQEKTFTYGRLGIPGNLQWGGLAPPAVRGLNGTSGRFAGSEWDYRIALQYRWTPGLMTYVQTATGFKGGGVNPRPFFPQQAVPFNPEKLKAYEVGFKSDLLDRHLRLNGAVFLNKYKDIQLTVNSCPFPGVPPTPCALPVNAGQADVKGAELESELHLFRGLSIDASGSYLHFKYTSLLPAAVKSGITPDMTTPFAPRWKYSAGAQYVVPLGGAGSLTPRVDWSFQSSFNSQAINSVFNRVPGYSLVNARLTWRNSGDHWEVALEGNNLADKLYYLAFFDNQGSTQNTLAEPGPPRQWAITLKRTF